MMGLHQQSLPIVEAHVNMRAQPCRGDKRPRRLALRMGHAHLQFQLISGGFIVGNPHLAMRVVAGNNG